MEKLHMTHNEERVHALDVYTHKEVSNLLRDYAHYKQLAEAISSGKIQGEKQRFSFTAHRGKMINLDPLAQAKQELEKIGLRMKFQNPLIWLLYKHEAYKHEEGNAITTLGDLVSHCEHDGICHKRFNAINSYLRDHANGNQLLDFTLFGKETVLSDTSLQGVFRDMCLDETFQDMWNKNENNPEGKWATYRVLV